VVLTKIGLKRENQSFDEKLGRRKDRYFVKNRTLKKKTGVLKENDGYVRRIPILLKLGPGGSKKETGGLLLKILETSERSL